MHKDIYICIYIYKILYKYDLKDHDGGKMICFMDVIYRHNFRFKRRFGSRIQPTRRVSNKGPEIGTKSIDWFSRADLPLRTETNVHVRKVV
jgi:hypothetical protein